MCQIGVVSNAMGDWEGDVFHVGPLLLPSLVLLLQPSLAVPAAFAAAFAATFAAAFAAAASWQEGTYATMR